MKMNAKKMLAELAKCSESNRGVTRLPYTDQHQEALNLLKKYMKAANLTTHLDAAGTLIGRREGLSSKTLLLGSHQDSVPQGGAYDGIMGVVLPICALAQIDKKLDFSVEVLVFADEEGVRFPTALIGSRAIAGTFEPKTLNLSDKNGITIAKAMEDFGLTPSEIPSLVRNSSDIIAYVETHIEQGPVLEANNSPLGIVSAICGIERHQITINGEAAHAGTMPMEMRKDALVVAARIVETVNQIALKTKGLLATIGEINVDPNAVNAVAGKVCLSLEIRAAKDSLRQQGSKAILANIDKIAKKAQIEVDCLKTYQQKAQLCDTKLQKLQAKAISLISSNPPLILPSGATHDASAFANLCPIAMFFVRCLGGVSHNPKEFVSEADLNYTINALTSFLQNSNFKLES